ncbi:MAG: UvrD-helicase domain-containing protein [Archangiaceae bacterium]|nr:UvrD-helicase domain-containing protein [Archangiaceae bacterium]
MAAREVDLLEDLNEPQREAVLHETGPLLVLSGAGSGKTRVITRRIAHLIRKGTEPWRILAMTFTNKAAREMKERVAQLQGEGATERPFVSTFHSASAVFLRRHAEAVGLSKAFVIYDDDDQLRLVKRIANKLGIEANPRDLLSRIDAEKNGGRLPDQMVLNGNDPRAQVVQSVYRDYQRSLRAADAVDFGDLLLLLVDLLTNDAELRVRYQRRYQHVMVDEFQDTNPVQYKLLKLLAPPGSNLAVVGDDDQSIYRWRGAEVDNILGFPRDYEGAKVVKLEQNYRSDQNILEAAYAVISKNRRRLDKKLWSARPKGELLQLLLHRDERAEAQEVARRINGLRNEGITDYANTAVFYRTNAQSRALEEGLRLARVPYTLVSGRSFYDRAEIRDASSYLRLMVNPKSDADLTRVINTPARGIGDTTVEKITEHAGAIGRSLYEVIEWPERVQGLNSGAVKRLLGFRELVERLVKFGKDAATATEAAKFMLEQTRLVSALKEEGTDEAIGRAENLVELISATQEFDKVRAETPPPSPNDELGTPPPPLQQFLEQISLVGEADGEVPEGRVSLMTLHAAKGLEFDAVFMTGMEEELFPSRRATGVEATEEDMAEERRLCYVGFTRARRRLFVSLCQQRMLYGEIKVCRPSRFISEVPQELFEFPHDMPVAPRPMKPRSYGYRADDGPQVDRTYDQSTEFSSDPTGSRVRHSTFGDGTIEKIGGQGPNAKVTVRFDSVGVKSVIARWLTPL